jgi:hypothetical protein
MVWFRISRSSGVSVIRSFETRLRPVMIHLPRLDHVTPIRLPTTDDRVVVLSRYTEPRDLLLLLRQLKIQLPAHPAPKIKARNNRELA